MCRPTARSTALARCIAAALAAGVCLAHAYPLPVACNDSASVDHLKTRFIACDQLSTRTVLDSGTAAHCSTIYECLKSRAFDNDWEALLAWWRSTK